MTSQKHPMCSQACLVSVRVLAIDSHVRAGALGKKVGVRTFFIRQPTTDQTRKRKTRKRSQIAENFKKITHYSPTPGSVLNQIYPLPPKFSPPAAPIKHYSEQWFRCGFVPLQTPILRIQRSKKNGFFFAPVASFLALSPTKEGREKRKNRRPTGVPLLSPESANGR